MSFLALFRIDYFISLLLAYRMDCAVFTFIVLHQIIRRTIICIYVLIVQCVIVCDVESRMYNFLISFACIGYSMCKLVFRVMLCCDIYSWIVSYIPYQNSMACYRSLHVSSGCLQSLHSVWVNLCSFKLNRIKEITYMILYINVVPRGICNLCIRTREVLRPVCVWYVHMYWDIYYIHIRWFFPSLARSASLYCYVIYDSSCLSILSSLHRLSSKILYFEIVYWMLFYMNWLRLWLRFSSAMRRYY